MSDPQSLANQLGWCITTQDYLNDLNHELRYVAGQYESMVTMLQEYGYIEELLKPIQGMLHEFSESADDLVRHVEGEHLAYIEKQSKHIQGVLSGF